MFPFLALFPTVQKEKFLLVLNTDVLIYIYEGVT